MGKWKLSECVQVRLWGMEVAVVKGTCSASGGQFNVASPLRQSLQNSGLSERTDPGHSAWEAAAGPGTWHPDSWTMFLFLGGRPGPRFFGAAGKGCWSGCISGWAVSLFCAGDLRRNARNALWTVLVTGGGVSGALWSVAGGAAESAS
eukprot:6464525-Amphidinium_carterae.4